MPRFIGKVERREGELVVVIPDELMLEAGIEEGALLQVDVTSVDDEPALSPELERHVRESVARNEAGLRYLAEH
jgi:hypothetical protein